MANSKLVKRIIIGSGSDKSVYIFDKKTGLLVRDYDRRKQGKKSQKASIKFYGSPLIILDKT